MRLGFSLSLLLLVLCVCSARDVVVSTGLGKVRGQKQDGYDLFKGIRYAEKPERFKVSKARSKWEGIADATRFGSPCIQPNDFFKEGQEDCLFLNIWAPPVNLTKPTYPVMVFIHGGNFVVGSGSASYVDGEDYARKGVILVSFNYRLGLLGFFAHKELTSTDPLHPTNFGLLDQILALEWVKTNIQFFGGDAHTLTVFGESSGAASIEWLLESAHHAKKPLFNKAIFQSAPFSIYGRPLSVAEEMGGILADHANCGPSEILNFGNSTMECLRNVPAHYFSQIKRKRNPFSILVNDENNAVKLSAPHVDGVNFQYHPYSKVSTSKSDSSLANYDIIVGTNQDEFMFFMFLVYMFAPAPDAFLATALDMVFSEPDFSSKHQDLVAKIRALYPKANYVSETRRVSDIIGDILFHCPAQQYAKALHKRGANVYAYVFAHEPTSSLNQGAYHAVELPFAFNKPAKSFVPLTAQILPSVFTAEEHTLGDRMVNAWIALGKSRGNLSFGLSDWPEFDGSGEEFLWMNITGNFIGKFKEEECRLWAKVYPGLLSENVVNLDIMQYEPLLISLINGWGFAALQQVLHNHKIVLGVVVLLALLVVYYLLRLCQWAKSKSTKKKVKKE